MTHITPRPEAIRTILAIPVLLLGAVADPASAQSNDATKLPLESQRIPLEVHHAPNLSMPDWAARQAELMRWINDYSKWREWAQRWANRREPGWFSRSRERRQRPQPPAWLPGECGALPEQHEAIEAGCRLFAEWATDYPFSQPAATPAASSRASEQVEKTIWWEHVHLDAGWPALQSGSGLYGVIGVHATTSVRGRLQIFVAPGAMLLNVPTRGGGRAWKVATNYGIAYRLGEFTFPGKRRALLHLNLAKAWLFAAGPDVPTRSTDFAGLSVTFKKTP